MKLVLLGTAGYHPSETRHTLCLLLPECGVMLDAGTGMFRAADYLAAPTLDIFLTHAHLDHVVGLTYLFSLLARHPLERVTVHAEADKLAALEAHLFAPELFPVKPPFTTCPLPPVVALAGGGRLTWFRLDHPGTVVGYRLDWPERSMAYVTDTTAAANADYIERIRGVDLLVHECYFPDGEERWARKTGHSWTSAVAEVAQAAQVGRLALVHLNPLAAADAPVDLAAARAIFPRTEIGRDRMTLEF